MLILNIWIGNPKSNKKRICSSPSCCLLYVSVGHANLKLWTHNCSQSSPDQESFRFFNPHYTSDGNLYTRIALSHITQTFIWIWFCALQKWNGFSSKPPVEGNLSITWHTIQHCSLTHCQRNIMPSTVDEEDRKTSKHECTHTDTQTHLHMNAKSAKSKTQKQTHLKTIWMHWHWVFHMRESSWDAFPLLQCWKGRLWHS